MLSFLFFCDVDHTLNFEATLSKTIDLICTGSQGEDIDKKRTKEMKEYLDAKNREVIFNSQD